jgi:hypothetical protein
MSLFPNLTLRWTMIALGVFLLVPGGGAAAPPGKGRVTAVGLFVEFGPEKGVCPRKVKVHGVITTDGPAEVEYTYESVDGARANFPVHILPVAAAGRQDFYDEWSTGEEGQAYRVWLELVVRSPNAMRSQRQSAYWVCEAPSHGRK